MADSISHVPDSSQEDDVSLKIRETDKLPLRQDCGETALVPLARENRLPSRVVLHPSH